MTDETTLAEEALADSQEPVQVGARLPDLAEKAVHLKLKIAEIEEQLKDTKARFSELIERDIPTAMSTVGVDAIKLTVDGHEVQLVLDHSCYGTLAKAKDPIAALEYLVAEGFAGGVQTRASVDFLPDEFDDQTLEEVRKVFKEGLDKDVNFERIVNPSTLRSFVRKRVEENPAFNVDLVGCTIIRRANVHIK